MNILTRKNGIWLCVIGVLMQFLNILTMTWWEMDIDIFGAMIFVLGLVFIIVMWKPSGSNKGWLTRKNGVWLCVIGVAIEAIVAFAEFLGIGHSGGGFGAIVFVLGIILIVVRWKH